MRKLAAPKTNVQHHVAADNPRPFKQGNFTRWSRTAFEVAVGLSSILALAFAVAEHYGWL